LIVNQLCIQVFLRLGKINLQGGSMKKNVRFGDYVQAVTVDSDSVSYSKLIPKPKLDKAGREIPQKPEKMKLNGSDIYNLLQPYVSVRFMEQFSAVVPLSTVSSFISDYRSTTFRNGSS
jgi:hypothetical protein